MTPPRILVVEKDRASAVALTETLVAHGYDTLGPVATCREALEAAEALRPDLAVMELRLEGACDGADAAALLHEGHAIPVILLSRNGDASRLDAARKAAVSCFLPNPPEGVRLVAAIETALAAPPPRETAG